jgi:hypothetical protein
MDREKFLTTVISQYEDVVEFYEDYNVLLKEYHIDNGDLLDEDIEENLVTIKNNLEFYYGDQFLQNLFEEFFEVDSFPSGLYDIFIDESYIEVEENNTLVFYFDYFIDQIKEFLDQSDIKYVFKDDVDYNELINSYNVIYPYKCMYRL